MVIRMENNSKQPSPEVQAVVSENQDSAKNSVGLDDNTIKQIEGVFKGSVEEIKESLKQYINLKFDGLLNTPKPVTETKSVTEDKSKDVW